MRDDDSEKEGLGADAGAVLGGFFRRYLEDRKKGEVRPLSDYQRLFPGHDSAIAGEFERLSGLFAAPAPTLPLSERLRRRFGEGVDPAVSLEAEASAPEKPSSELLSRLSAHAPKEPRYRFVGEVARGGMGAILRVFDEDLRRTLAMKVALGRGDPASPGETPPIDAQALARFLEEAQVTGQLDHPGIVPVHELGLDSQGRVFFTMRLVRGRDLKEIFDLVKEGKEGWTQTRALGVLLRVCEAMAYAHSKGVVHRDLKPGNVMVGRFGEVYVMDWGLARVIGRKDTKDLRLHPPVGTTSTLATERTRERELDPLTPLVTMDGTVVGTPSYMPPEQARGEVEKIDRRSDVYSLGAMIYQLLAGHMPYVPPGMHPSGHAVWKWVLEGSPTSLRKRSPQVPPELESICEKAMARDQARRYPDTLALADDLRAYLEGRVVRAHKTGPVVQFKKWVKRNRPLAASLAGILAILAGAGAWLRVQAGIEEGRFRSLLASAERAEAGGDLDGAISLLEQALGRRPGDALATERKRNHEAERDRRRKEEEAARGREKRLADAGGKVETGRKNLEEYRRIAGGLAEKRRRLRALEAGVKGPEGPDVKRPVWALASEIRDEEARTEELLTLATNDLHNALALAGADGFPPAKAGLADLWYSRFEDAVATGKEPDARLFAGQVRLHDEEKRYAARLDQVGTLALRTDPPGARAYLFLYVEREQRLWPAPFDLSRREARPLPEPQSPGSAPAAGNVAPSVYEGLALDAANDLGATPIEGLSLPHGSYLLVLRKEGYVDVRYPVLIRRGQAEGPRDPIRLWSAEEHPDPERWVYVPEGLSILGGDPEAFNAWPRREEYVAGFFLGRFEVTSGEWLEFLNDPETIRSFLEARKKGELPYVPRQAQASGEYWTLPGNEEERFEIKGGFRPDWPVFAISWDDAKAYVAWLNRRAEERGEPWEYALPKEEEWERAAKGADGRAYPWGDGFDWTFCKGGSSRTTPAQPEPVGLFPADESPFGVRDMAGSMLEWCENLHEEGKPYRTGRGGAWGFVVDRNFRSSYRVGSDPGFVADFGCRLVRRARAPQ